ncbi:hypothetical protein [Branchiibius hedensis]|nr:hypothetical protein [Branchiibius hedensis]
MASLTVQAVNQWARETSRDAGKLTRLLCSYYLGALDSDQVDDPGASE